MTDIQAGNAVKTKIDIEGIEVGEVFERLEWKAMVNNGYIVRARLSDPYYNLLKDITDKIYLRKARKEPIKVTFNFEWQGDEKEPNKTEDRIAYMINLYGRGELEDGRLEFIAIDPPTWLLSRGKSDGKYYQGSVSDVIKKVCQENGVSKVTVSKTIDNKKGEWWMMRQDPKTFIASLLEWSPSVVTNKTKWIVTSKDEELYIKEEHDLKSEDLGLIRMSIKDLETTDCDDFELLMDNFSHVMYSEEHTASLSAISGYYIDQVTEKEKTRAYDKNTGTKSNTNFDDDRGFDVTDKRFSTFAQMIPEESAGNVGLQYKDYIDGRARREFLNMVGYITRLRARVTGAKQFDDPLQLGVSTVTLQWVGLDGKPYFLAGNWMITGFYHIAAPGNWQTSLYINRLDWDAAAKKVGPGKKGKT